MMTMATLQGFGGEPRSRHGASRLACLRLSLAPSRSVDPASGWRSHALHQCRGTLAPGELARPPPTSPLAWCLVRIRVALCSDRAGGPTAFESALGRGPASGRTGSGLVYPDRLGRFPSTGVLQFDPYNLNAAHVESSRSGLVSSTQRWPVISRVWPVCIQRRTSGTWTSMAVDNPPAIS